MSIHIGSGNKITGTIIMEGSEVRGAELTCLKSLRIEDGTIFIETKDNAKVVIDGQAAPRRCCANCKHCDVWDQGYDMPYIKCGNPEKMDDWGEDHDLPRGVVVCEKWESIEKWEEEE